MKRSIFILCLAVALSLVFAVPAFANFGPHGGYATDTDACAGCHRAHSSFSSIKYTPRIGGELLTEEEKPSALLVGSAATMTEFCNACHGNAAPGASTNVVAGEFDSGPSTAATTAANPAGGTFYVTGSTFGGALNGGGFAEAGRNTSTTAFADFQPVTSAHGMEQEGVLWGAGNAANQVMTLTCTGCHDPHGSSNYRLLKDSVNGVTVGGYTGEDPNGMVFSTEQGYPYATNGWLKHDAGALQMASYIPNYTSGSAQIKAGTAGSSISAWCSACHTQYDEATGNYDYLQYEGNGAVDEQPRHRHPVDIPLKAGDANLQVIPQDVTAAEDLDKVIPLEVVDNGDPRGGHIGCLTCHFAHGSAQSMGGWAAAHLTTNTAGDWVPAVDTTPGVEPDKVGAPGLLGGSPIVGTSALLRADNRGVCERCHNK